MYNIVLQTIKKHNMIEKNDSIVVGVSGGADSVSLLHILHLLSYDMNLKIVVVHVNHGLRGQDALEDERFVKTLCNDYNIEFKSFKYNIKEEAKKMFVSEEEAGRIIRYNSFNKTMKEHSANKIAVAHNMNDNSETLLMRFCRGTGVKGLAGISPIIGNIIRPLINCKREQIEQYCKENTLLYKNDYTNNIDIYTRNKIRLKLIPWIEENLNQSIISTLSKTSAIMNEENEYLDKLALEAFNKCIVENNKFLLKIDELKKFDDVIKRRIIRIAYTKYSGFIHNMSYEHINMVLSLLDKQTGKSVNLPHNLKASRQYEYIYIYKDNKNINNFVYDIYIDKTIYIEEIQKYVTLSLQKIKNNTTLVNNYTIVFDYDKIYNVLQIRKRISGDKIYLKGIKSNKKIKDIFIDLKIPRDLRDTIPVIADGNNILCIMGYKISDLYKADLETKNKIYLQIWEEQKK